MSEICQSALPIYPWTDARTSRLPGVNPMAPGDWLWRDDAFAAQMDYRDRLLATRRDAVHRLDPAALPAAAECLTRVLDEVAGSPGYVRDGAHVTRPDGVTVDLDADNPLVGAARLTQADLCLMERRGAEHVLTGAVLCFPASWTLDQKFGRPLIGIHHGVEAYDGDIAPRVQRMFDVIRPGPGLWRANHLVYCDPDLHQPRREGEGRFWRDEGPFWMRVERQGFVRLPDSGAVVFSIHTHVVPWDSLPEAARRAYGPPVRVRKG
jgi:hypothetical protein